MHFLIFFTGAGNGTGVVDTFPDSSQLTKITDIQSELTAKNNIDSELKKIDEIESELNRI